MPAQLSKLHVRFIQTQKDFFLQSDATSKNEKLSLAHLYIKNSSSFYFANQSDLIDDLASINLLFKEENDYLSSLRCKGSVKVIEKDNVEYEEALLFFHQDASTIKQILLLMIETIEEK